MEEKQQRKEVLTASVADSNVSTVPCIYSWRGNGEQQLLAVISKNFRLLTKIVSELWKLSF
jgi:hypothetical protein